jgi:hypothetical protein
MREYQIWFYPDNEPRINLGTIKAKNRDDAFKKTLKKHKLKKEDDFFITLIKPKV